MHTGVEIEVGSHDQVFDRILNALRSSKPIIYSKINHGFWERLVILEQAGLDPLTTDITQAKEIDNFHTPAPFMVETGFIAELFDVFQCLEKNNPDYIFSAGLTAWPHSDVIEGTPTNVSDLWTNKIRKIVPDDARHCVADGIEFKRALVNGRFKEFADEIVLKPFLFVGNDNLKKFPEFLGAKKFEQCLIDGREARRDRHDILKAIKEKIERNSKLKRVLIQAGGSLSAWLIHRLYEWDKSLTIIDLGVAADVCSPQTLFQRPFGIYYRAQLIDTIDKIHPGWLHEQFGDSSTADINMLALKTGRAKNLIESSYKVGIDFPRPTTNKPIDIVKPVSFIENKPTDLDRVGDFLALSVRENHFANAGPVSRHLENVLHILLKLPKNRKVIMCSSCTAGLHVAAGLASIKRQRKLNWVGSVFGFQSSNISGLSDIKLIDCGKRGHIDVAQLEALQADSWDGVLFTNTFATGLAHWRAVRAFCKANGKAFIVDNAVGLKDRPEGMPLVDEIEVVSCHHTKPWGAGEGGFMIVNEADEDRARRMINFGFQDEPETLKYSFNAKISDLACAAILDRIERMQVWNRFYLGQALRVRKIIEQSGLQLSEWPGSLGRRSPTGNLQLLSKNPISLSQLENEHFVMRKYYMPLAQGAHPNWRTLSQKYPNATALYRRIINIPCHTYMREVSGLDIVKTLRDVTVQDDERNG